MMADQRQDAGGVMKTVSQWFWARGPMASNDGIRYQNGCVMKTVLQWFWAIAFTDCGRYQNCRMILLKDRYGKVSGRLKIVSSWIWPNYPSVTPTRIVQVPHATNLVSFLYMRSMCDLWYAFHV